MWCGIHRWDGGLNTDFSSAGRIKREKTNKINEWSLQPSALCFITLQSISRFRIRTRSVQLPGSDPGDPGPSLHCAADGLDSTSPPLSFTNHFPVPLLQVVNSISFTLSMHLSTINLHASAASPLCVMLPCFYCAHVLNLLFPHARIHFFACPLWAWFMLRVSSGYRCLLASSGSGSWNHLQTNLLAIGTI